MEEVIASAMALLDRYVVAVEVPPGIGKTYSAVRVALNAALRGHTVIFALPNHSSLITAFAYAVNYLAELRRTVPKSRLPYVIYYEGVERFCPLRREENFMKAVDNAVKNGDISEGTAARFRKLGLSGVSQVYGMTTVCRLLCPTYAHGKAPTTEKIILPKNTYDEITSATGLTGGEQSAVLREAAKNLLAMKDLVFVADPKPFSTEKGYCIRMALMKGLGARKTQLIFKGGLILVPVQALDFVFSLIMNRYLTITATGARIPPPTVVLDEYDYYIYNKAELRLVTLKQLVSEVKFAKEVLGEELERRLNEGRWDIVKFVSALLAVMLGEEIISRIETVLEKGKVPADAVSGWESLVAEVATAVADGGDYVIPPLAPRVIDGDSMRELMERALSRARAEINEFASATGIVPPSLDNITPQVMLSYLQEFEAYLVMDGKDKVEFLRPVLTKSYWRVLDLSYAEAEPFSALRALARLANYGKVILVYSLGERVEEIVKKGKKVKERGVELLAHSYDIRFARLFSSGARILMMSATGLPWAPVTFTTRAGGYGAGGKVPARSVPVITTAIVPAEKWRHSFTREYAAFLVANTVSKPLVVITLLPDIMRSYASHAQIVPVREFQILPPRIGGKVYYAMLWNALAPYIKAITAVATSMKRREGEKRRPAVLVFTQRKDVAFAVARAVASYTSGKLSYCSPTKCGKRPPRNLSHILVKVGDVTVFVTWLRSRMSRGVDVPPEYIVEYVFMVGSPYRPPTTFDIVPEPSMEEDARLRTTAIELKVMVSGDTKAHQVVLAHNPLDIAESVGELVQAVGRALRRAWQEAQEKGQSWTVRIVLPGFAHNKILMYAPIWFKLIGK